MITCRDVTVRRGGRAVLDGIGLSLRRGEVAVLMGPNGAGKSTLLAVLAGLLSPDAGTVETTGRVAAALQGPALAARTARANVELAVRWWGVPRADRDAAVGAALAALGASALADRPASTLSGGEARRVHLARALAVRPDVLLLDEPFAGLDASTRADLLYDAETAFRSPDRAVLVVVHDRAEAWALADRVLVLVAGRLIAAGTPAEVFHAPDSEELADFAGFTGRIASAAGILRVRPAEVVLDDAGPVCGTVRRRVPLDDGVLLEVDVDGGRVETVAGLPGPATGAAVRLRATGGRWFSAPAPR